MDLPKQKQATNLIDFIEEGEVFRATPETYKAWIKIKNDARRDGIFLVLVSAFRSIDRQKELVMKKRKDNIPEEEIFRVLARPGYSEHHTGRALDLHTPNSSLLEEDFEHTDAFKWLQKNGSKYGFFMSYPKNNKYNIIYEPWHWCFKKN
ncbi:MAG: M15 family metallopeptidase [Pontiellaceae bacterium]